MSWSPWPVAFRALLLFALAMAIAALMGFAKQGV